MMKKLFCLLILIWCLASAASAETWCSIVDIRNHAPSRWTQTYETKWRTVIIDAEVIVPQVEKAPVVLLEGGAVEPTITAEEAGWDSIRFVGAYMLSVYRDAPDYPKKVNGVRLGTPYAQGNWYSGFAPENRYVPLDDITFGEITDRAKAAISLLGYDPEDFMIDDPSHLWAHHIYEYGRKKDALPGYIFI